MRKTFDEIEVMRMLIVAEAKGQILGAYKLAMTNYFRDTWKKKRHDSFSAWRQLEGHKFYLVTEKLAEEQIEYYAKDYKEVMNEINYELAEFYRTESRSDLNNYEDFKSLLQGG
ncbi:hypothetical protein [Thalassotalea agarivorans]|uniref:Uncharacterized protein n=1 Tax=Thalassotalea agarivorans TaxID=349064 RepID=A0A1I0H6C4_THASX|nr:hypothetical protein [Thalassotalea agarivorans]SET78365.1 hypothetical protein SAMN05660429_02677 [Thalassotalea agarivorans]